MTNDDITSPIVEPPSCPPGYQTQHGRMFQLLAETFLSSSDAQDIRGKVQLLLTSPPFPLNRKKLYGNEVGERYLEWLTAFADSFRDLLTPDGSIVIELGNAWEKGSPTMSTLNLEAMLAFKRTGNFHLCQQFVCHNPARLPSPVQWVNVDRIRVKDSFTHIWWMSSTPRPKADNRQILSEYSPAMLELLKRGTYNSGKRESEHNIGEKSFCIITADLHLLMFSRSPTQVAAGLTGATARTMASVRTQPKCSLS